MSSQEGVIKFRLEFTPGSPLPAEDLQEINHWRQLLYGRRLIGQDPARYGGYGFGNISQRLPPFPAEPGRRRFVISGTQTGHLEILGPQHYAIVTGWEPDQNLVIAQGPIRPSSESLTHGTVYDQDEAIRWVMHVHSPELWQQATHLGLPTTAAHVPYGTPAMAREVERLFRETDVRRRGLFAMGGHEDGMVAFGATAEEAGMALLDALAAAVTGGRPWADD